MILTTHLMTYRGYNTLVQIEQCCAVHTELVCPLVFLEIALLIGRMGIFCAKQLCNHLVNSSNHPLCNSNALKICKGNVIYN